MKFKHRKYQARKAAILAVCALPRIWLQHLKIAEATLVLQPPLLLQLRKKDLPASSGRAGFKLGVANGGTQP